MAITERENMGKDPYGFATVWMLSFFIDQLEAENEQSLVYQELKIWAEHQGEAWHELSAYGDSIRARASTNAHLP